MGRMEFIERGFIIVTPNAEIRDETFGSSRALVIKKFRNEYYSWKDFYLMGFRCERVTLTTRARIKPQTAGEDAGKTE